VAIHRAELVDHLVLIGQYFNDDGRVAGGIVDQLTAWRAAPPAFLHEVYDQVSPDGPAHFPVVFAKLLDMIGSEPKLTLAELSTIGALTLVLQGDRDEVLVDHSAAVAAALPRGRLAVLPGSHLLPLETPRLVNDLLAWFLQDGPTEPILSALMGGL